MARTGSFTPVLECVHVIATALVDGRDAREEARHDLLLVGGGGIVVERHSPHGRTGASGREAEGFVRRVEVVLGREHLVAGFQPEPAVHDAEAHRGAVGHRQLGRVDAEVLGPGGAHRLVELGFVRVEVAGGVLVEPAPVRAIASATGRGVVANTKAAKWARSGLSGSWARTDAQSAGSNGAGSPPSRAGGAWPGRRRCRRPAGRARRRPRRRPHR